MTKKDFVTAWLLAARVGSGGWTEQMMLQYIVQGEDMFELLEKRYAEEDA